MKAKALRMNETVEWQCPVCSREFSTEIGMHIHQGMLHHNKQIQENHALVPYLPGNTHHQEEEETIPCGFKGCNRAFRNERGRCTHHRRAHCKRNRKRSIAPVNTDEDDEGGDEEEEMSSDEDNEILKLTNVELVNSNESSSSIVRSKRQPKLSYKLMDCSVNLDKIDLSEQGNEEGIFKCPVDTCGREFRNARGRWVHFGMSHGPKSGHLQRKRTSTKSLRVIKPDSTISKIPSRKRSLEVYKPSPQRSLEVYSPDPQKSLAVYKPGISDVNSLEELGVKNTNSNNLVKLVLLPPKRNRLTRDFKNYLVPVGRKTTDLVYEVRLQEPPMLALTAGNSPENDGIDDDMMDFHGIEDRRDARSVDWFDPSPEILTCNICHEQFSCLTNLRKHLQSYPDTLPWPCGIGKCNQYFRHQSQASLHRKYAHPTTAS